MAKKISRAKEDHLTAIKLATGFHVTRLLGFAKYENLGDYSLLKEAQDAKIKAGKDLYGRPAMIYAIVPGRASIFVE